MKNESKDGQKNYVNKFWWQQKWGYRWTITRDDVNKTYK